ncbi:hypothetical protein BK138_16255 [Paenibacillus rhizosphaerae]|uniref:Lin1244/Lin1753-like N-terminal domain-containing protein n=1 Tax=Paenibacillus rhizosphaerae TaxID=297318 RepID=A0A1R1ES92_9BACL|nr:DUF4373 domain-containing protein [Paenibacillus rhizosphaerae]OMF54706.1 hypothetical protein BK138_16255 [Paenibacillus rhizosphaerae]
MARPRKEGMDYFPHDTDAVNDTKIEALRMLYGNDGYAFYFILLELIYRQPNFELDVSDAETIQILARKVEVTPEKFNNMLQTAIKRECFDASAYHERCVLTSEGVKKRSKVVTDKREKMRTKSSNDAENELLPDSCEVSDAETGEESTQSKSKSKRKVKEKEKINKTQYAEFVTLTQEEYDKLVSSHGEGKTKRMIEVLDNYKGAKNKKYASDYRAILNWVVERVGEEEQRSGNKGSQPFTGGSAAISQYNQNNGASTKNGQTVSLPRDASGDGTGLQKGGANPAPSKYDQFVRR